MTKRSCTVLLVDDRPDEGAHARKNDLAETGVHCTVLHPSEVDEKSLLDADLVLVDFELDAWPSRDNVGELGLRPPDGLALAATLRRRVSSSSNCSPTAFGILTGKMRNLANPLPATNREHILSAANGLEWVFSKTELRLSDRIKSLAQAAQALPEVWSVEGKDELAKLLAVRKAPPGWRTEMIEDSMRCLPAVHESSAWSHGLAFLRWLLQRILPYPTFIIRPIHLAARLRLDPAQLNEVLADESSLLRQALKGCEYRGILADFDGPRWWRAGVEAFLWDKTRGNSFDANAVRDLLEEKSGLELQRSTPPVDPVVCYDGDYRPAGTFLSLEDAVRIRPDDWPSFADQAWVSTVEARKTEGMRAVVVAEDLGKLNSDE